MTLPVPPGYEAFAAHAPAPAAPEVIIFSFIYLFFPFASPVSLKEGFGLCQFKLFSGVGPAHAYFSAFRFRWRF